jgi:glycosyltransferase involved in cell wall biosynthesis
LTGAAAARKVCFVLPSLNGGGAERAAVQILNALNPEKWDRQMYLFRGEGPYLNELSPSIRLEVSASPTRVGRWQALRRFIRKTRPHVVMSFLSYLSVLSAARASGAGTRVVFNQQTPMSEFLDDPDYEWRRPFHRRLFSAATRSGYARADLVVTSSRGVADDLIRAFGVDAARIRVVHNPVDLAKLAAKAAEPLDHVHAVLWDRPVLVAAGRLAEAKNYPLMIDAMALLRRRMAARLFILGAGELEATLRRHVADRRLDDAVVLCGFQSNPWKYMARADLFVLTSRYEGFGNVLVEALACGAPVVATTSDGTREIVRSGIDGLLVDRHEPESVANALEELLRSDDRRRGMAAAGVAAAGRFALPLIASAYDRVLLEAIA